METESKESKIVLCPYCGATQEGGEQCRECGGLFEPLSRRATQIAMGPWYIRDKRNPFRPGCSYEILVRQVKAGRIKPHTVLRGPTTRQFWSVARNVPGLAHLLGYCHSCGAHVSPHVSACPKCGEAFRPVKERNELGLMFPTEAAAQAAQRGLEREMASEPAAAAGGSAGSSPAGPEPAGPAMPGADLLNEVLGTAPAPVSPRSRLLDFSEPAPPAAAGSGPGLPPPPPAEAARTAPRIDEAPAGPARTSAGGMTGAAAATVPAGSPAQALDFGPSDESAPADSSSSLATQNRRMNLVIWIIVAINILAVIAAVAVYFLVINKNQTQAPKPAGDSAQPASSGGSTSGGGAGERGVGLFDFSDTPRPTSAVVGPNRAGAVTLVGNPPSVAGGPPPAAPPGAVPAAPPSTGPAVGLAAAPGAGDPELRESPVGELEQWPVTLVLPDPVDPRTGQPLESLVSSAPRTQPATSAFDRGMDEVRALERRGQTKQAVDKLHDMKQRTQDAGERTQIDAYLAKLTRRAGTFFDIPLPKP